MWSPMVPLQLSSLGRCWGRPWWRVKAESKSSQEKTTNLTKCHSYPGHVLTPTHPFLTSLGSHGNSFFFLLCPHLTLLHWSSGWRLVFLCCVPASSQHLPRSILGSFHLCLCFFSCIPPASVAEHLLRLAAFCVILSVSVPSYLSSVISSLTD